MVLYATFKRNSSISAHLVKSAVTNNENIKTNITTKLQRHVEYFMSYTCPKNKVHENICTRHQSVRTDILLIIDFDHILNFFVTKYLLKSSLHLHIDIY